MRTCYDTIFCKCYHLFVSDPRKSRLCRNLINSACDFVDTHCNVHNDHSIQCDGKKWTKEEIKDQNLTLVYSWPIVCLNTNKILNPQRESNDRR